MDYWARALLFYFCQAFFLQISAQFLPTAAKTYCQQVPDRGPCHESVLRWYYDVQADNCSVFSYGGCLGNQNSFESADRCELTCRRRNSAVGYMFATGLGPNLIDDQRRTSDVLGVDGRGNTNVLLAAGASINDCDQPVQRGFCSSFIPRWHHNGTSCELFYYSGCGGNSNNYLTRESCQDRCQFRSHNPFHQTTTSLATRSDLFGAVCQLRPQRGNCRSAIIRWYFDQESQTCLEFVYSGCNGNENNYAGRHECEQRCSNELFLRRTGAARTIGDPFASPVNSLIPAFEEQSPDQFADAGVRPSEVMLRNGAAADTSAIFGANAPQKCSAEPERGPCTVDMERWYFDKNTKTCRPFYYGGCMGNANRFSSRKECEGVCATSPERKEVPMAKSLESCLLEPATGPCRAAFSRYYFDVTAGQCKQFTYGGCEGNANNFLSPEECQSRCSSVRAVPDNIQTTGLPQQTSFLGSGGPGLGVRNSRPPTRCNMPSETGPCRAALSKWFFNGRSCERFVYGGCAGNDNNFDSQEECQAVCGGELIPTLPTFPSGRRDFDSQNPTIGQGSTNFCVMQPDSGPCDAVVPRFFSDPSSGLCKQFTYGGCGGNLNNFRSLAECELSCRMKSSGSVNESLPITCTLPAERGPCRAFIPAFFHDVRDGKCKMFYFGGCQGNDNRFSSRQECEGICSSGNSATDLVNQLPRQAPPSIFGGSSTSQGRTNVCELPAESGSCLAMIPSYFYDGEMNQCRQFIYGGCGGNANRFASTEECESKCRPVQMTRSAGPMPPSTKSRKNPDCLLATETGPCRGRFKVFGFDANQQDCVEFTYGGCNGNGNRFSNREDCMQQCGGLIASDNSNMMKLQQLNVPSPTLIFQQERRQRFK